MLKTTAAAAFLFLAGVAQAQAPATPEQALRAELERTYAKARSAAKAGDFEAFMQAYEPSKGRTLIREQWPAAREAVLAELANPARGAYLRAVRKGWWAGYFFREPADGTVTVTMHRFHMGEHGWRLRGESVTRSIPGSPAEVANAANAQNEIDTYPAFQLPE